MTGLATPITENAAALFAITDAMTSDDRSRFHDVLLGVLSAQTSRDEWTGALETARRVL